MSSFNSLDSHLDELYKRHRALDEQIKELYTKFARDEEINRLKTKKLWLKDEIYRIERELNGQ